MSAEDPQAIEEEREEIIDEISPEENVFSYFLLAHPREKSQVTPRTRKTYCTTDSVMSHVLVFLTLSLQAVLLYCVYMKVVVNNEQWRDGIMNTGEDWNLIAPAIEEHGQRLGVLGKQCNDGSSLCTWHNGTFTCAPPSVQLSGRWDELDLDGDGIWTHEEAVQNRDNLKCKYALDAVEAFHVFSGVIAERQGQVWIHPDVLAGKAIHKTYFTYAMGDIIMCGYRNEDMCGNLLKRGVFDAPLKYGTSPRVGQTIDSALDYCRKMLQPRGTCERLLPSTYATWKIESTQQCKKPKYSKMVYKHPGTGHFKSLLAVDYKARQKYENAKTPIFQIYKAAVVGTWILIIIAQLRGIGKTMSWVIHSPGEVEEPDEEEGNRNRNRSSSPQRKRKKEEEGTRIDMAHRIVLGFVTCIRAVMNIVLMYTGLEFLARQTDYIGLLLDGIALIFIIDLAEIIYLKVLRQEVTTAWANHEPLIIKLHPHLLNRRPDFNDTFWLAVVIISTVCFMWHLELSLVNPLYNALECACLSDGSTCHEASAFNFDFWQQYWRYDVPRVLQEMDSMRVGFSRIQSGGLLNHPHRPQHYHLAAN